MTQPLVPSVPKAIKWDLWLTLTLTCVNIIGGITFWLSLPEKIKQTKEQLVDHEQRIRLLESDRGLLQRIDERTRAIQDSVKTVQDDVKVVHADFGFALRDMKK